MASYLGDMERHLLWLPCTRVDSCDQHKCPDISNQFPEGPLVHYGKHFHDLLPCAALVWQNHGGILKPIKRHITGDHGSYFFVENVIIYIIDYFTFKLFLVENASSSRIFDDQRLFA